MIVCVCKSVSDRDLANAIADGACSVEAVARCTKAGTGCGACRSHIREAVDMATGRKPAPLIVLRTLAAIVAG